MEKKTFGSFLSALRKANGMTQQDLADRLSVSNKAVSRWERDENYPDLTLLPVIAEIFNVTTDELLSGEKKAATQVGGAEVQSNNEKIKSEKQAKILLKREVNKFSRTIFICVAAFIVCDILFGTMYAISLDTIGGRIVYGIAFTLAASTFLAYAASPIVGLIKFDNYVYEFEGFEEDIRKIRKNLIKCIWIIESSCSFIFFTNLSVFIVGDDFFYQLPIILSEFFLSEAIAFLVLHIKRKNKKRIIIFSIATLVLTVLTVILNL